MTGFLIFSVFVNLLLGFICLRLFWWSLCLGMQLDEAQGYIKRRLKEPAEGET